VHYGPESSRLQGEYLLIFPFVHVGGLYSFVCELMQGIGSIKFQLRGNAADLG